MLRAPTAVVFLPVNVTLQGGVYKTHSLLSGYAFVRRDNPKASYYTRLANTKLVETVLTRRVGERTELALIKGSEVRKLYTRVKIEADPSILEGDKVCITSGTYKDVDAEVLCDMPETGEVQVRVKMRSLDTILTLPRSFMLLIGRGDNSEPSAKYAAFDKLIQKKEWLGRFLSCWKDSQCDPPPNTLEKLTLLRVLKARGFILWERAKKKGLSQPESVSKLAWLQGKLQSMEEVLDRMGKQLALFEEESAHNVLVDGHYFVHRAMHAMPDLTSPETGEPTGILYGFLRSLGSFRKLFPDGKFTVVFDGYPKYRKALCPSYKGNRVNDGTATQRHTQVDVLKELLPLMGIQVCHSPDEEADDILFTLARENDARKERTTILTSDQDILQCCSDHTSVYMVNSKETMTPAKVEEKYGVPVPYLAALRALEGDTSDNLPGVERVASKVLRRAILDHGGSIMSLYGSTFAGFTKTQYQKFQEAKDRVFMNLALMPLYMVPEFGRVPGNLDKVKAAAILTRYGVQADLIQGW